MHRRLGGPVALALALSAASAGAQHLPVQNVEIHGFGSWNSGATNNPNRYLGGINKGSSLNSNAGVTLTGRMDERLSFTTQVKFSFDGATKPSLDYVFGEYKFADALRMRAGQVKQPFGLYAEVIDIGPVRPFITAPQAIYGNAGNVGQAYRGIGLTGNLHLFGGTSVDYDVYGGGLNRDEYEFTLDAYRALQGRLPWPAVGDGLVTEITDQLYGARVMYNTPILGMRVGGSGYHGLTGEVTAGRNWVSATAFSFEYIVNRVTFRSEALRLWESDHDRQNGWYYEGAYRVYGNWQIAGLYDRATVHLKGTRPTCTGICWDRPPVGESLLNHEEMAGGINYLFSPNFVMKLSYHHVDGNRFSQPDPETAVALLQAASVAGATTSPLPPRTNAVLLGAQFSF